MIKVINLSDIKIKSNFKQMTKIKLKSTIHYYIVCMSLYNRPVWGKYMPMY